MDTNKPEDSATSPGDRALSWAALLEAYRTGSRQTWSGVLVERLGPWLTAARRQLIAVPPFVDDDDIAQQLVLEVLNIASRWNPLCEDNWIPRRLVERAGRKVVKGLLAERLEQPDHLEEGLEARDVAEPDLVLETPIGKASVADLRLIWRATVVGEPISELAAEAGLTPEKLRRRLKSAKERARAGAPGSR